MTTLLRDHISIAGEVVAAAKSGNNQALDTANTKWFANADAIAAFFAKANPNWTEKELGAMLHSHLDFLTQQVVARLNLAWLETSRPRTSAYNTCTGLPIS